VFIIEKGNKQTFGCSFG